MRLRLERSRGWLAGAAVLGFPAFAVADIDPLSGIDFVRIGAVGNAPWMGDGTEGDRAVGRGSVGYEYNIGRFEVTTSQWVQFFNAAYDRPQAQWLPHLIPPTFWGAQSTTPNTPGGRRWAVPAGNEMRPVGNISWRMAAMYCNWLHNGQGTNRDAFLNGAYDVGTFGIDDNGFTDQHMRSAGARYWIPSWDESLKASHYDPHLNGGQGGWWTQPNGTNQMMAYGPPGVNVLTGFNSGPDPNGPVAQANGGWLNVDFPGYSPFTVPLGAYPQTQSPWGLLDVAGGTTEWTEEIIYDVGIYPVNRLFDGSPWQGPGATRIRDAIGNRAADFPSVSFYDLGFRVASSVPTPGTSALGIGLLVALSTRRRNAR